MRPIRSVTIAVNQIWLSGPTVIPKGRRADANRERGLLAVNGDAADAIVARAGEPQLRAVGSGNDLRGLARRGIELVQLRQAARLQTGDLPSMYQRDPQRFVRAGHERVRPRPAPPTGTCTAVINGAVGGHGTGS